MSATSWLPFDSAKWESAKWLHQWKYDPRPALERLAQGEAEDKVWEEFWNYLHHQGDVCERSYLTVVALSQMPRAPHQKGQLYVFVATVEIERHRKANPDLPDWLRPEYRRAWIRLTDMALGDLRSASDDMLVRSALGVVAIGRNQLLLGALAASWTADELVKVADSEMEWSRLYDANRQ